MAMGRVCRMVSGAPLRDARPRATSLLRERSPIYGESMNELLPHPVTPAPMRGRAGLREWPLLAGEYLKLLGAWLGLSRPGQDRNPERGLAPRPGATQDARP